MVKNPQRGQGRTVSRVVAMERAIVSGWSPRAWKNQSAIRSAERGPIPGIWRSCAIKSRIAEDVPLRKTGGSLFGVLVNWGVRSSRGIYWKGLPTSGPRAF